MWHGDRQSRGPRQQWLFPGPTKVMRFPEWMEGELRRAAIAIEIDRLRREIRESKAAIVQYQEERRQLPVSKTRQKKLAHQQKARSRSKKR